MQYALIPYGATTRVYTREFNNSWEYRRRFEYWQEANDYVSTLWPQAERVYYDARDY